MKPFFIKLWRQLNAPVSQESSNLSDIRNAVREMRHQTDMLQTDMWQLDNEERRFHQSRKHPSRRCDDAQTGKLGKDVGITNRRHNE